MTSKSDEIKQAHEDGTLLLHLLEFNMTNNPDQLQAFFDVLSGKPGAKFSNFAHYVSAKEGEGYVGLPTTALKKGQPVKLYYEPKNYTGIGLLMNANSPDVDPLFVGSTDAWSGVQSTGKCMISGPDEPYPELRDMQGLPRTCGFVIDLNKDREQTAGKARAALTRMWEIIEEKLGTLSPEAELNEVLVRAHTRSVKGIVIDEGPSEGPKETQDIAPPMTPVTFKARVKEAKQLNKFLMEKYPEVFKEPLPIFGYSKLSQNQLVELTPAQQLTGEMPDHGEFLWEPKPGAAIPRTLG